jgi:hypothetical protein
MKSFIIDGLGIGGALTICGGLWWMYPPVAVVALGATMLGASILGAKKWA